MVAAELANPPTGSGFGFLRVGTKRSAESKSVSELGLLSVLHATPNLRQLKVGYIVMALYSYGPI